MSSTSFQGDTSVSPSRGQLLKVIPAVPDHLGTGSPGKRWNPHPGKWWSPMWMWHSGTRVSGDRGGAGGMVGLHLGELSRPSWLHGSSLVLREHAHTGKFNGNTSRRGIPVGTLVGGFPSFQSSSELGFPGFHLLLAQPNPSMGSWRRHRQNHPVTALSRSMVLENAVSYGFLWRLRHFKTPNYPTTHRLGISGRDHCEPRAGQPRRPPWICFGWSQSRSRFQRFHDGDRTATIGEWFQW